MSSIEERFNAKVDRTDDCWLWTANVNNRGYGTFGLAGTMLLAHRVAYELWVGPIPEGLVIDHLCGTQICVRPDHLEAVTQAENVRRARRTHCVNGHEFTPENTRIRTGTTWRVCRTCAKARGAQTRQRRRLEVHE